MEIQLPSTKNGVNGPHRVIEEGVRLLDRMLVALLISFLVLLIPVLASETLQNHGGLVIAGALLGSFIWALNDRYR